MEPNFDRPHYQETDRRPFLFYAVMGAKAEELHVSRSRHHVEEMPEGLALSPKLAEIGLPVKHTSEKT